MSRTRGGLSRSEVLSVGQRRPASPSRGVEEGELLAASQTSFESNWAGFQTSFLFTWFSVCTELEEESTRRRGS